jgi:hypothetical protein
MGDDSTRHQRRIDVPILDLDRVAAMIAQRRDQWASVHGLVADPVTWMDADAAWPRPLHRDRSQVVSPMSVGVRIRGEGREAEIVVYAGGWADADCVRFDDYVSEYVELDDADAVQVLLDRVITILAGRGAADE